MEEVSEQPHQERGEDRRAVLQVGQLNQRDQALALGRGAEQVCGLELGLPEELVGTLVGEVDQFTQDQAGGGRGESAELLEVGLSLVAGEVPDHRAKVGQVETRSEERRDGKGGASQW